MLNRRQADALLSAHAAGADWSRHCRAVAQSADRAAPLLAGVFDLDTEFLWRASLLHDIGRFATHDPVLHGVEGFRLLTVLGHEHEARVCASHILFGLTAEEASELGLPPLDFVPRTFEERLVPLLDYLIEFDRPTTLESRFVGLRARNADNAYFMSRLGRAETAAAVFLGELDERLGVSFEAWIVKAR